MKKLFIIVKMMALPLSVNGQYHLSPHFHYHIHDKIIYGHKSLHVSYGLDIEKSNLTYVIGRTYYYKYHQNFISIIYTF